MVSSPDFQRFGLIALCMFYSSLFPLVNFVFLSIFLSFSPLLVMSSSSSSSSNASLPPHFPPSSISLYYEMQHCFRSTAGTLSITLFTVTSFVVLLPLYIYIAYLGLQRWRQQHSSMTMNHSDVFTYHMVAVELISVTGSTLICCGVHTDHPQVMMVGICLLSINIYGQMLFHILTCVERYLAVVHPVTYLSLRKASGIRIRNTTIGCVWVLSFAGTALLFCENHLFLVIFYMCVFLLIMTIVSFCSLSVLCVLIRPGPRERGGGRQQVDQSKLRAFYTILAILGVLLFRFGVNIIDIVLYALPQLVVTERCVMWFTVTWYCLPSSLVLPVLFLHRADKLHCSKNHK